jgi:3-methyladenine DNA glycosylase/8-oxoguanine DNA glycosylase
MKKIFVYKKISTAQINALLKLEPKLINYLDLTKPFTVRIMPDHYQCLVHSVISQQLTSAAVDAI